MLNHENEHKKALKTGKFSCKQPENSNLPIHVSKFAFQGIYMFEFCPKIFSNHTLSSTSTTMFNTSRQKNINIKLKYSMHINIYPAYDSTKYLNKVQNLYIQ